MVNTTTFPAGTTSDPGTFPIVAGGTATLYAGYPNTNPDAFQFMELCAIYKTTGTTWPGTIPYESIDNYVQRINKKVRMAVGGDCTVNKRELVFFDNTNLNRIQFFAAYKIDAYAAYTMFVRDYGAIEDVLPMDTYDDEDQIKLINVDMLGSKPVVTAKLKRRNGGRVHRLSGRPRPRRSILAQHLLDWPRHDHRRGRSGPRGNLGMQHRLRRDVVPLHRRALHRLGLPLLPPTPPSFFRSDGHAHGGRLLARGRERIATNQPHTLQATLKSGRHRKPQGR